MGAASFLGSTLLQSRADASALLGGLGHWTRRSRRVHVVRLEVGGDQLEVSAPSEADQERLIQLFLERRGKAVVGTEHVPQPALPPAVQVSATGKHLQLSKASLPGS